ncbi:MAG TPA: ABC transporter permease [Terriglobales bacterium]
MLSDIRYALRQFRRARGFTAMVVLTLGLAIGVNAAMFTIIDAVLLRALPYPEADRLVELREQSHLANGSASVPNVRDWQEQTKTLSSLAYWSISLCAAEANGVVDSLPDYRTSPNFFSTVGVQPLLGRSFTQDESVSGKDKVVVLSYGAWQQYFHGDRNVLGQTIKLGQDVYTVIGVMPKDFVFPNTGAGDVAWSPLPITKDIDTRDVQMLNVFGRLKPGVTVDQARADLSAIQGRIKRQFPSAVTNDSVRVTTYRDAVTARVRPALLALQGAVFVVWLIACANVASMMLARAAVRRREIAVRMAIGAARARVVRQLLIDSLLLALASSALGLALGIGCVRLFNQFVLQYLPFSDHVHVNGHVFAVLIVLTLLSAVFFGVVPALHAASAPAQDALKASSQSAGVSRRQRFVLNGLVAGEVALCLLLLVTAGLLLRSLYELRRVPLGFAPDHMVTATMFLPQEKYANTDVARRLDAPLLERVQHLPGVAEAAIATTLPLSPNFTASGEFEIVGRAKDPEQPIVGDLHAVSANFFRTLRTPIVKGRSFSESDGPNTQFGVIINEAFAKKYFPNEDPIGHQIKVQDKGPHQAATVIGIAGDTHQDTQAAVVRPEIDLDYQQMTADDEIAKYILGMFGRIVLRTNVDPASLISALRSEIHGFDPAIVVGDVKTMDTTVEDSMGQQRLAARLLWVFAGVALLISIVGIYGSLSYVVSRQTRDIGLRMAFGATREAVRSMVMRQSAIVVASGVVVGAIAALMSAPVLRAFLYGVKARDSFTYVWVSALLLAFALLASYVPARRASNVEPMRALRDE